MLIRCALALVAVATLLGSLHAGAQVNVPRVFLGFTSSPLAGNVGVLTYHAACAAKFPSSRMCTSEEVLRTPTTPSGLSGNGWVQPVCVPAVAAGLALFECVDASGISAAVGNLSCMGWGDTMSTGLFVDPAGRFDTSPCNTGRRVSCCGLPLNLGSGDLDQDGIVSVLDETVLRRLLAGYPIP